jgi:serine/threonine protein kinase
MEDLAQYQETVIGSYRLFKLVGVGPMSRAHLAERQDWPERKVVVKLFEAVHLHPGAEQDQILEEVRLLTYLEHPGVLPLLDDGIHGQTLYLVSSYVEGVSLRQRLNEVGSELLPLKEALALLGQVGEALHFAHTQGVVHANLKPENIFIQSDGTVLLADFLLPTLARSAQATRLLSTFSAFYMAPEQFGGTPTPLSDQYALACLAYELLTGQPPFEADNLTLLARMHATQQPISPAQLQPARAQHVAQGILQALSKRPDKRYPDMQAFLADLCAPPPLIPDVALQQTTAIEALVLPASSAASTLTPEMLEKALKDSREMPAVIDVVTSDVYDTTIQVPFPSSNGDGEVQALVPYQEAALPVPQQPARFSRRGVWLSVALVCTVLLVIASGFLFALLGSSGKHPIARVSISTTQTHATPVPGQTQPGVTPGATEGTIALQPTPTPTPIPPAKPTPTTGTTPTSPPASGLSCSVHYQVTSQWRSNFIANVTINNTSSTSVQGWTLIFSFSAGQQVMFGWNGHFTQHKSQVTVTSDNDNTLAPGNSITPGFSGRWNNTSNPPPTSFSLNGVACS